MADFSRGKLLLKMALQTNDRTNRSTPETATSITSSYSKADIHSSQHFIPVSSTTTGSENLFNDVSGQFLNEPPPGIESLKLHSKTCSDTDRLITSDSTAISAESCCHQIGGNLNESTPLSPDRNSQTTDKHPLYSPFKTTFGTKPKVASPGSNLYRIQGTSVRQITPEKLNSNLVCYDSDDLQESDFDDSDNDPNWQPEKKRRLLVFNSDDGVEPLPEDDDTDISPPNTPTNGNVQVIHPESPNTPQLADGKSKRARRGKPVPLRWDRNQNKTLRMKGKSYRGVKRSEDGKYSQSALRHERKLKHRKCSKACAVSKRCGELSEEDRLSILNSFWEELTWKQKKVFVANMVDQVQMVERKKRAEDSRKKNSYRYHLKKNDQRIMVCRNMFLSTLDLQDKTVYEWVKNVDDGIPKEPAPRKPRESTTQSNKLNKAKQFLQDLPKLPSHYCRSTSKKSYIEPLFTTFSELFKVYIDDCKQDSKPYLRRKAFRSLFDDMNLAIHRPKKDKCDVCSGFEAGTISEEDYNLHITRKMDARNEKARDKLRAETDGSLKVITLDLQSLLLCPLLTASSMYYKTKLGCHNYTIFDLVTKEAMNYFWHEGVGDLNGSTFASCLADFILGLDPDVRELIIFSDGCTYQNRNAILSNMLLKLATEKGITITQKYLEKGHTQMECDSVHSTIERRLRGKPIYIPQNYVDLIRTARVNPPYKLKYLTFDFFKNYNLLGYYTSIRPGTRVGDPVVTDIRVLSYKDGNIQYKLKFADQFEDLPRRNKKCSPSSDDPLTVYNLYDRPVKIKAMKFNHLQELKKVVPPDFHPFYDNLDHE